MHILNPLRIDHREVRDLGLQGLAFTAEPAEPVSAIEKQEPEEDEDEEQKQLAAADAAAKRKAADEAKAALAEALKVGDTAAIGQIAAAIGQIAAATGMGGIGKTQTALAFAHGQLATCRLVWWLNAETPAKLAADYICKNVPKGADVAILQGIIVQSTGRFRADAFVGLRRSVCLAERVTAGD